MFKFAAVSLLALPLLARADDLPRTVSVTGTCNRRVTPDRGSITVTAEALEMDLQASAKKSTETYEKMKADILKLKLDKAELRTVEYSLQELKEWEKNKNVFKGFRSRMGLQVATASTARLGEVIEIAARHGVRDVGSLRTYLSEERQLQEHVACLEEAAKNAQARAEKLASSLGAKVGPVLDVSESSASMSGPSPIRPFMMSALKGRARGGSPEASYDAPSGAAMSGVSGGSAGVEAGTQDLSVTIQATFYLR